MAVVSQFDDLCLDRSHLPCQGRSLAPWCTSPLQSQWRELLIFYSPLGVWLELLTLLPSVARAADLPAHCGR